MYKKTLQLIALLGLFGGEQCVAALDPCADIGMPSCLFYGGGDGICHFDVSQLKSNLKLIVKCYDMNADGEPHPMSAPWNCTKYGGGIKVDYWNPDPGINCYGTNQEIIKIKEFSHQGKPGKVTKVYQVSPPSDPCKEYGMGSCPGSFTKTCVNFFFASCHGKENCLYADCATTGNVESGSWKLNQFIENPTECKGDIENDKGEIVCKKK